MGSYIKDVCMKEVGPMQTQVEGGQRQCRRSEAMQTSAKTIYNYLLNAVAYLFADKSKLYLWIFSKF